MAFQIDIYFFKMYGEVLKLLIVSMFFKYLTVQWEKSEIHFLIH